ncbi:type II toxin-antitoxin system VapC family toxin [Achromobacter pestifer]
MKTVLDASVALGWLMARNDQAEASLARHLLEQVKHFKIHVPRHWHAEVGNGMLRAQRARAVSAMEVSTFLDKLDRLVVLPDRPYGTDRWRTTHHIATTHALTAYDAAYLDLAARLGGNLATFDRKLADAARAYGVPVFGQPHGIAEPRPHYG